MHQPQLLDCGYESDQQFYDRLKHIAYKVRNNSTEIAKRAYHHRKQVEIDLGEFVTLSESCAFLAFIELDGDVEKPTEFDWEGKEDALVKAASALVRRDLQEKGSESHDVSKRNQTRQDGSLNACARWDAWDPRVVEERQEREEVADTLTSLLPELRAILKERDVQLLVWHYVEGKTWRDINTLCGLSKSAIGVALLRAKERAKEALGERWYRRLRDAIMAA